MKLTVAFTLLFTFNLFANGYGQQVINLKAKRMAMSEVLTSIEKQTTYRFLYNNDLEELRYSISINARKAELKDVLPAIFAGTTLTYQMMDNNLIVIKEDPNVVKDVVVTGQVLNETGQPLPGVSVQVKGTTTGTTTDADGNFTISVPNANSILVFSYVGYNEQEYPLNGATTVTLVMAASQQVMDQVVVVGYGTQRKVDVTGSVAQVKGEEIARMPNTNPVSSLQGKVAGLTISNSGIPGAAPTVRIRGVNSTNSATPLYVVDGVLHDNIDFLNPADIETIDVLRDPSSIAIYGLRGANGVIAITSKKAARGQTRVSLQSSAGFSQVINRIAVTDAQGFQKLYNAQLANTPGAAPFDYSNYRANTNWQDLILRKAFLTNQSLSVSNSGEKTTTYLNLGYNKQEGVVKYGQYERFTARLTEEIRITDKIKVGGDIAGSYWNLNPTSVSLTNALWAAPIVPVQAGEDLYYSMPSFQRAQVGNPIASLNRNNRTSINRGYRFVGSLFAEIKLLRDFTWKSIVYTDLGFNNNRGYSPLPYRFINLGENGPSDTTYDNRQFTSVSQGQEEFRRFQQDHTLTWDKNFNTEHRVTAVAGFTTVYTDNTGVNGNRRDTTLNIPYDPDYWYLGVANINNPGGYGGGGGKSSLAGAFGRVNYAFRNKYLLNATIRRDGSSKFSPENRWGTFGSVGAGWVVSSENFFNVEDLNFLKLRAAWGKIGNSNGVPDNLYQPGVSNASTAIFGDNVYTAVQAAYIPDPNLHWEVVRGIDVGVEIRALQNRLNTEINWYDRTTTDILTRLAIPNDSREYFTNMGKITNRGVEVTTGWSDRLESDLNYGINANFSYNKNFVNSIGDNINFEILRNGANKTETGYSIGYFYGYRQTGVYQSLTQIENSPYFANALAGDISFADIDGNDTVSTADRTYLGTPFPPYSFGVSFNIGYKGFDFMLEGQGVAGNKIYTQRRTQNFATLNYETNRLNAWTEPGTSNIEPILDSRRGNNYLFSSYWLEPGDYFRLRTVQLGYNLNPDALAKTFVKQARVYISGQNVKTWSRVSGYSPEAPIGDILGGGADNGIYPVPATYTIGVNLTF